MSSFGESLLRLWPNGDAQIEGLRAGMISSASEVFRRYRLTNSRVLAHFMAQISHECGAGKEVVENLNYSAARLMQVWPSRFLSTSEAQPYAGNPRLLANKVYNGRMGNAPGSNDGWVFRGRGAAQTTGREGYKKLAAEVKLDLLSHPDLVNDPKYFLLCGAADFILCGCLPFAEADDIVGVTKHLNGGAVGLQQRRQWLAKWKMALGDGSVVLPTSILPSSNATVVPTLEHHVQKTSQPASSGFGWLSQLVAAFGRK